MIAATAALNPDTLVGFDVARKRAARSGQGEARGTNRARSQIQGACFQVRSARNRAAIVVESQRRQIESAGKTARPLNKCLTQTIDENRLTVGDDEATLIFVNTTGFAEGKSRVTVDGSQVEQVAQNVARSGRADVDIDNTARAIGESAIADSKVAVVTGIDRLETQRAVIAKTIRYGNRCMIAATTALNPNALIGFDIARERAARSGHGEARRIDRVRSQVQRARLQLRGSRNAAAIVVESDGGEIEQPRERAGALGESLILAIDEERLPTSHSEATLIIVNTAGFAQGKARVAINRSDVKQICKQVAWSGRAYVNVDNSSRTVGQSATGDSQIAVVTGID